MDSNVMPDVLSQDHDNEAVVSFALWVGAWAILVALVILTVWSPIVGLIALSALCALIGFGLLCLVISEI
jgi:hypothetical protein